MGRRGRGSGRGGGERGENENEMSSDYVFIKMCEHLLLIIPSTPLEHNYTWGSGRVTSMT